MCVDFVSVIGCFVVEVDGLKMIDLKILCKFVSIVSL